MLSFFTFESFLFHYQMQNLLLLKATSQAAVNSIQDCLAMMNVQLGRHSRGESPSVSNPSLSSPSASFTNRRVRPRSKRPVSMIEPREKEKESSLKEDHLFEDEEEGLMRSVSVSEVQKKKKTAVAKTLSKEAP